MEGLADVLMKRNIPFAEYPTYKQIKELGKAVGVFSNIMCGLHEGIFSETYRES